MADPVTSDSYDLLLLKYKLLFDHARDMILFIDKSGRILDANKAAIQCYGYTKQELTQLYVFELRKYDTRELVESQMKQAINEGILFETVHRRKDGSILPVEVSSTGVELEGTQILMSIIRDVTAKQEYVAQIQKLAFYDELTGVLNRKSFRDAVQRLLSSSSPFALMLLDIDNFKKVNDTCSQAVGDKLLIEISKRITGTLAGRGVLYRLGGDEFTVICESLPTRENVICVAEDLLAVGRHTIEIGNHAIRTTLSIGISLFPENGQDESLLLRQADTAMYRVKESTKDGYSFVT
jgi:diguanylate cyclase (GGDEF)-like protein/PAS domain S-box-containing protein